MSCVADCWRTPGHKGDCSVDMTAAELDAYLSEPVQLDMFVEAEIREATRRWFGGGP